MFPDLEI